MSDLSDAMDTLKTLERLSETYHARFGRPLIGDFRVLATLKGDPELSVTGEQAFAVMFDSGVQPYGDLDEIFRTTQRDINSAKDALALWPQQVKTWADGWGTWHAIVSVHVFDPRQAAHTAIVRELRERDDSVDPYMVRIRFVEKRDGKIHYREADNDDE